MKLIVTMIVRDEDDVLEANLVHHLSQGADLVLVTDHRSEDATPEILDRYARAGHVHVFREGGADYLQQEWQQRMAQMAATELGADWVIGVDADEFWWPITGTVAEALAAVPERYGIVSAPRPEFAARPEDSRFFAERMVVREAVSNATLKVAHRAHPEVVVGHANHYVDGAGLVDAPAHPLRILHFPLRSLAQFEKRTAHRIREPARRSGSLPPGSELHRAYQEGRLAEAYAERVLTDEQADLGVREGRLAVDRRLEAFLAAHRDPTTGAFTVPPAPGSIPSGATPERETVGDDPLELEFDALQAITAHERKWRERADKHKRGRVRAEMRLEEAKRKNEALRDRLGALQESRWARLGRSVAGRGKGAGSLGDGAQDPPRDSPGRASGSR